MPQAREQPETPRPDADAAPRVLVIGLDGVTFALLDRWMERGLMPNLRRLAEEGTRATLRSVLPPVTGPAWTSFATGVRPGRHGIFDFRRRTPGELSRRLISSRDVRVPTVWDALADAGLSVGLINVPVTYPPSGRTSFAISDMLTPSTAVCFTHPPSLYDDLRPELGEYVIDAPPKHLSGARAIHTFLDALEHCTRQRTRYTVHLMQTRPWDFCMVVFVGTDRLQHVLWDALAEEYALYPPTPELLGVKKRAEECLALLDAAVGEMLAACPPRTDVFIVSDHGFGPLRRRLKVNQWLARLGLLTASRRRGLLGRLVSRADIFHLRHRLARLLRRGKGAGTIPFWRWINWSRTRAYSPSISEMGVYVNLSGREAQGIVAPGAEYEEVRDRVLTGLRELRHPETGEPMLTMAFRKEELFSGPHLEDAPDVVFMLEEGACTADVRLEGPLFEAASWRTGTGTHRRDGILIARGPRIRAGQRLPDVEIFDVAPALLHLFGLSVPEHVEGRIPEGLLTEEAAAAPVSAQLQATREEPAEEPDSPYSEEEARQVEERLRNLGYL